jgi:hypothetical protein
VVDPNIIFLKDISALNQNDDMDYIRYEIEKPNPNYGASSDLLRYKILYEYGGAYFDSDVSPGERALEQLPELFNIERDRPILFVDINSQNQGFIGNDAFICSRGNPLMQDILAVAKNRYLLNTGGESKFRREFAASFFNEPQFFMDFTVYRTGPMLIRHMLGMATRVDENELEELGGGPVGNYEHAKAISKICVMEEQLIEKNETENTGAWLKTKENKMASQDIKDTIIYLKNIIRFEIEKMKILRLGDYLRFIEEQKNQQHIDINAISAELVAL